MIIYNDYRDYPPYFDDDDDEEDDGPDWDTIRDERRDEKNN